MKNNNQHILVLEDNPALANVLLFNLQRAGFKVTHVINGQIGWEKVQQQQFDMIITDLQMPEMDGIEFCRHMRSLEEYSDVPTILLTAKGMEIDLPSLIDELGFTAVYPKPFSPSMIVKAVEDCLAPST